MFWDGDVLIIVVARAGIQATVVGIGCTRHATGVWKDGNRRRSGIVGTGGAGVMLSPRIHILDYSLRIGTIVGTDGDGLTVRRGEGRRRECKGMEICAFR